MLRVYDFECWRGHVTEMMIHDDEHTVECPTCAAIAVRKIPAPRSRLDPISGDFPGATAKWERNRDSRMAKERKHEEDHGTTWIGQNDSYTGPSK